MGGWDWHGMSSSERLDWGWRGCKRIPCQGGGAHTEWGTYLTDSCRVPLTLPDLIGGVFYCTPDILLIIADIVRTGHSPGWQWINKVKQDVNHLATDNSLEHLQSLRTGSNLIPSSTGISGIPGQNSWQFD